MNVNLQKLLFSVSISSFGLTPMPAFASVAYADYISGDIKDITSVRGALMVRMDDDKVPSQCAGSGSSWLRINQADATMVSVVLSYWMQGKKSFTLYIEPWQSGYCTILQADPVN